MTHTPSVVDAGRSAGQSKEYTEVSEKPPKFKDLMSAEENKKTCCDWSRESALFPLADSQLLADQVRQAGAMTPVPILICLSGRIELPKAGFRQ